MRGERCFVLTAQPIRNLGALATQRLPFSIYDIPLPSDFFFFCAHGSHDHSLAGRQMNLVSIA
jgi:hypothetical protein